MRSGAIAGRFDQLIEEALNEEFEEFAETNDEANALTQTIRSSLPLFVAVVLVPMLLFITIVTKRMRKSIEALQRAASKYTSYNLEYRTELISEKEFEDLGHAFNRMAHELNARREVAARSRKVLEETVRDVTRELEIKNKQLIESDKNRRQFLADISHELRTPLTVIQGESEMALRGANKEPNEYCETLNKIVDQTVHTSRLVDDLLFIARAEDGKARINRQPIEIIKVLRSTSQDLKTVAEKKRVTIIERYDEHNIIVFGDAGRLRQVFTILLENAIRYSDNDSTVDVDVSITPNNDKVEVIVRDHGIGLTDEEFTHVFDRFYRGNDAQRHAEGTGLGLPVAKAIVESHEGEISLTGIPGDGAQALVRLPCRSKLKAIA